MAANRKLRICLATAELAPLAKTGGLADVSAALSVHLDRNGHELRVLMPRYGTLNEQGLDVVPVDYLQNIGIDLGGHHFRYSIDTATLPGTALTVYLLRCPALYHRPGIYTNDHDEHLRFVLLSRAAIEMCQRMAFAPDIFHSHDWHTALIPLYLRTVYAWDSLFSQTRSVLTIHNIGYQGVFGAGIVGEIGLGAWQHMLHQDDLGSGRINFMRSGVLHSDLITTVSPTYAQEILGDEYGMGMQHLLRQRTSTLVGILNGVDYDEWSPENDTLIPYRYSRKSPGAKAKNKLSLLDELGMNTAVDVPLFGMVSRLASQKGVDLLQGVLPGLMQRRPCAFAVLGSGEERYEHFFRWLQATFPGRVCFYRGYNNRLAHMIEAGSDMFLMPSLYEPCGLNQMYSLRYGTVPVVRETGGLADSVQLFDPATGQGTGLVFRHYDLQGLAWAMNKGLDWYQDKKLWRRIMRNGMAMDYSWETQGQKYVDVFEKLIRSGGSAH